MGQKDITEKLLEDYNDVFADIINGLIFKGEQRILPESLENAKVHSQYKAEDGKVHESTSTATSSPAMSPVSAPLPARCS